MKMRRQLEVGYAITIIFLVGLIMNQSFSLNKIDKKKNDILQSIDMVDAIMESKYFLRTEMQLLMEMVTSNTKEELSEYWEEYNLAQKSFDKEIAVLLSIASDNTWGIEFEPVKQSLINKINLNKKAYSDIVLPGIETVMLSKAKVLSANLSNEEIIAHNANIKKYDNLVDKTGTSIILNKKLMK
jgi:hypothetical protein